MSADLGMAASAPVPTPTARRLQGSEGVWVFVFADMAVFALMFACFMWDRNLQPDLFEAGRRQLSVTMGGVNTLILLSSSMLVVLAVDAVRHGRHAFAAPCLGLASACGLVFIVNKVFEYGEKFDEGISMLSDPFFMYYFILTGIHLGHVVVGTVIVGVLALKARAGSAGPRVAAYEGGATYWHMVDLLWVCLFPLLYLVR